MEMYLQIMCGLEGTCLKSEPGRFKKLILCCDPFALSAEACTKSQTPNTSQELSPQDLEFFKTSGK